MEWPCLTNASYRIDYSDDLIQWWVMGTSISTNTGPVTNTVILLDATSSLRKARFYRIMAP
jgi:hypothetical protein